MLTTTIERKSPLDFHNEAGGTGAFHAGFCRVPLLFSRPRKGGVRECAGRQDGASKSRFVSPSCEGGVKGGGPSASDDSGLDRISFFPIAAPWLGAETRQSHLRSPRHTAPPSLAPPSQRGGKDLCPPAQVRAIGEGLARTASTPKPERKPTVHSLAPVALALLLSTGCRHAERGGRPANAKNEEGKTAGITVIHPEKRDIRMTVVQPGTIQAFEVAPIFSRIAGYVENYKYNIGDRVKRGDVLLDMWIPDLVEQLGQKSAAVKRAQVQIRVTQKRASRRRGQGRDRPGRRSLGGSRRQAGTGQLRPLGFGVQAARHSGQTKSPGRPGP